MNEEPPSYRSAATASTSSLHEIEALSLPLLRSGYALPYAVAATAILILIDGQLSSRLSCGMLEVANLTGIDPEAYLRHVLEVSAVRPVNRAAELLQWIAPSIAKRVMHE